MLDGLYSAAAGMAAQQQRMDAVANDLANVSTTGYKKVRVGFRDLLYTQAGKAAGTGVREGAGSAATQLGRTLEQGSLQNTGRMLDVAIQGQGFMRVRQANGTVGLTRDGSLYVNAKGQLVTSTGGRVLPAINVPAGTSPDDITIATDGTVLANSKQVGKIQLVTVRSPEGLTPVGDNLFTASAASGPIRTANGATLQQGFLEGSNVDLGDAMVDMMDSQRSFQLASKAIQMQDEMAGIANGVKQ
jgi:flagellar basal-body rod protein FlgG